MGEHIRTLVRLCYARASYDPASATELRKWGTTLAAAVAVSQLAARDGNIWSHMTSSTRAWPSRGMCRQDVISGAHVDRYSGC